LEKIEKQHENIVEQGKTLNNVLDRLKQLESKSEKAAASSRNKPRTRKR